MKTTLIFLLAILSLSGYAQDSLLIKDVFDFNVGDIFHYYTYYAGAYDGWISEVDTLKNKSYSTNYKSQTI